MQANQPLQKIVVLTVRGVGEIPSFKNGKRAIFDKRLGQMRTLTKASIKKRMVDLEDAIECALYLECTTATAATDLECRKQLRIALCGLSDDSLKQIPTHEWTVDYVGKGQEGVRIEIEEIV